MQNFVKRNYHMDDLQIINNYDSILDVVFNGTKYTTKIGIILTYFNM